jgi:PAS domain-containing protein
MTFTSEADEVFYYLQGLDQKSDILNLLPMAAYVVRADGVVIWYNARAAELWGRKPAIGDTDERFCGAHTLYHPDGTHMAHCDTPVALALSTGISVLEEEVVIGRPDGSRVPCVRPYRPDQKSNGWPDYRRRQLLCGLDGTEATRSGTREFASGSSDTLCGASGSAGRTGSQNRATHNRFETSLL